MNTFSETTREYAKYAHITIPEAHDRLVTFVSFVNDMLTQREDILLHGLGKFSTKDRAPFQSKNPRTMEPIEVPACVVPTFKFSSRIKENVKTLAKSSF